MKLLKLAPLVLVLGTLACGGSSPPPAAPAEPAPPASAEPAPAPAPSATTSASSEAAPAPAPAATEWKAMDKEARGKYMKEVVMPKMKELFTAFDAKEFGAMNCATCHGKSVADHSFKMPNPDLPKLPSDMAEFKKWAGKHPKTTEFMVKQVKPEMAKLLGMPEFNPETKVGFGCGGCHTMK